MCRRHRPRWAVPAAAGAAGRPWRPEAALAPPAGRFSACTCTACCAQDASAAAREAAARVELRRPDRLRPELLPPQLQRGLRLHNPRPPRPLRQGRPGSPPQSHHPSASPGVKTPRCESDGARKKKRPRSALCVPAARPTAPAAPPERRRTRRCRRTRNHPRHQAAKRERKRVSLSQALAFLRRLVWRAASGDAPRGTSPAAPGPGPPATRARACGARSSPETLRPRQQRVPPLAAPAKPAAPQRARPGPAAHAARGVA